jgi:hypothetical protein
MTKADALRVEAFPDMLAALEEALEYLANDGMRPYTSIRAAIAKARGES